VPAEWGDFRVTRRFRGTTYRIAVRKPAGVSGLVTRLLVDGRSVEGNLVPLSAATTNGIEVEAFVEAPVEDVVEATP
jgi:cellobiose phosphorylase